MDFVITETENIHDEYPQKRDCFVKLQQYLQSPSTRVYVIYGLRRTGKTVLLKQALLSLSQEQKKNAVFITCNYKTDFYNVIKYIKEKLDKGSRYFFIDEVTYANNFQNLAEVLSDNFVANYNARIVLTGTDSLGLSLPSHANLYDRAEFIHTTYVSFPEYARLTGNNSVDYYIKHGSTLSDKSPFDDYKSTQEYIETSIVSNMLSSLQKSESVRSYPPALTELYEYRDLDNAIQRIINRYPQTITLGALRKQFKLHPLGAAITGIITDKENPDINIKSAVLEKNINENVKRLLHVEDFKTPVTLQHLEDIKSFLKEMDVIISIPVFKDLQNGKRTDDMELLTHPGMYHSNLKYTIDQLANNNNWMPEATQEQKERLLVRTYDAAAGTIQENFIINDVYNMLCKDNEKWYVSKLSLQVQNRQEEADLIVFDRQNKETYLFEIKHSVQIIENQASHLESKSFLEYVENAFGTIKDCAVLYNGKTDAESKTPRINAADFLVHIYENRSNPDYTVHDTILHLTHDGITPPSSTLIGKPKISPNDDYDYEGYDLF